MRRRSPERSRQAHVEPPERSVADTVNRGASSRPSEHFKRIVRRQQLRLIIPLADTTIYEMEQRGEFPRRIYLTPRCAGWDLDEIEAWIEERRRASGAAPAEPGAFPDVRKRKWRPVSS